MIRKQELMYSMFGKLENAHCKDCCHFATIKWNRTYFKCTVYGNTNSEATDWAKGRIACGLFNREYRGDIPIVKLVSADRKRGIQVDGQIGLFDKQGCVT